MTSVAGTSLLSVGGFQSVPSHGSSGENLQISTLGGILAFTVSLSFGGMRALERPCTTAEEASLWSSSQGCSMVNYPMLSISNTHCGGLAHPLRPLYFIQVKSCLIHTHKNVQHLICIQLNYLSLAKKESA